MNAALLIAVALPLIATAVLTWPIYCGGGNRLARAIECAGVALALTVGVTSISFFAWRLAGASVHLYPYFDVTVLVLLTAAATYRLWKSVPRAQRSAESDCEPLTLRVVVTVLLAAIVWSFAHTVLQRFEAVPHGEWDAWAMWNMRAAFLATPTQHWADGFTLELGWAPPDYPLLVPASVARLWTYQGEFTTLAPQVLAIELGVATALVCAGSLARLGGFLAAAVGVSFLLVPGYAWWVTAQCADVAVGLYILTAVVLMADSRDWWRLSFAGIAAGLAAWSKNEGLVAVLVTAGAFFAISTRRTGLRQSLKLATPLALGLGAGLIVVVVFKTMVAPASQFAAGLVTAPTDRLFDAERHRIVATYILTHLGDWGHWRAMAPIWLVGAWVMIGFRGGLQRSGPILGLITVILMFVAYHLVYVLTTQPLMWQMQVSWGRLLSQIWPTLSWTAAAIGLSVRSRVDAGPGSLVSARR